MQYYRLVLYFAFGILPSLTWLFYYLHKDIHPEPKRMILKVFILGMLVTIPVFLLQLAFSWILAKIHPALLTSYPLITGLIKWFLIVAFIEEFLKYAVVKFSILGSPELDEPLDLMLYMVVAALGFAALENTLYLFSPGANIISFDALIKTTVTISFIRFIGATFLHTLCSATIGYFMARASMSSKSPALLTFVGIGLATLLHGLYDFSIMTLPIPFSVGVPIAIMASLALFITYDFDQIKKVKGICKL